MWQGAQAVSNPVGDQVALENVMRRHRDRPSKITDALRCAKAQDAGSVEDRPSRDAAFMAVFRSLSLSNG
jgi:hypothetical protein